MDSIQGYILALVQVCGSLVLVCSSLVQVCGSDSEFHCTSVPSL